MHTNTYLGQRQNKKQYLDLLLLADEQEVSVKANGDLR